MSKKGNRPGWWEHPGQQVEMEDFGETPFSKSDYIIFDGSISSLLFTGQENAVPLRYLKKVTGFDGRTVRRMIFEERLSGIPILADNLTGYFLPATQEEKQRCVRSMNHRADEIKRAARAIEVADIRQNRNVDGLKKCPATRQERISGWF